LKQLIINADDFNLTPGVTRGILKSHDEGILTSTTVLINLPLEEKTIRELKMRPKLGLGIHLNVTLAGPVSPVSRIPTLLKPGGIFRRPPDYREKPPSVKEIITEYKAQIRLFERRFQKLPDHLDTHHHLHDHLLFFDALASVAKKWKLPIRRSRIFQWAEFSHQTKSLRSPDYLFGSLDAQSHWKRTSFLAVAENLPEGTSEIGCHPAFCDVTLREISSFREVREEELAVFSDRKLRKTLSQLGIELIRFSDLS